MAAMASQMLLVHHPLARPNIHSCIDSHSTRCIEAEGQTMAVLSWALNPVTGTQTLDSFITDTRADQS